MKNKAVFVIMAILICGIILGTIKVIDELKFLELNPGNECELVEKLYPGPWGNHRETVPIHLASWGEFQYGAISEDRFHILLLWLGKNYLMESIMVLTIDTTINKGRVIYVPGETTAYLSTSGDDTCKINEIYYIGRRNNHHRRVLLQNIETITGISPHYYIEVTSEALISLVDMLGGIIYDGKLLDGEGVMAVASNYLEDDLEKLDEIIVAHVLPEVRRIRDANQVSHLIWLGLSNVKTNMGFFDAYNIGQAAIRLNPKDVYYYSVTEHLTD